MEEDLIPEKKLPLGQEELLNLIEIEDIFTILSEENMEGFNELVKYELICIKDDKVFLTDLGREAQVSGVKNVLARKNVDMVIADIPSKLPSRVRKSYLIWSLLILLLAMLLFIFQMIWQPE